MTEPSDERIEPATAADLDAIDVIERHSFKTPWSRDTFAAELARAWARLDVVRADGGIAGRLLAHVLEVARAAGCRLATLEVRRGNAPAIALYEHAGFRTVHVRARYYQDDGEDALVMLREL